MDIRVHNRGSYTIIEIHGDVDYYTVGELKKKLFSFINDKNRNIILDLGGVEYLDSSGIGLIVTAHKVMNSYGGTIGLLHVKEVIRELLKMATVDTLLPIYASEQELK